MQQLKVSLSAIVVAVTLLGFLSVSPTEAGERLYETQYESRVILAFAVPEAAAQARLPEGLKLLTFPGGPFAGSNQLVIFMDRHLGLDPEGKTAKVPEVRAAVLVNFGVEPDAKAPKGFVTGVYITDVGDDPYGVSLPASVVHDSTIKGPADGPKMRHEQWEVYPEAGGSLSLSLSHKAGVPVKSKGETRANSVVNPDYHHVYRYEQLADLAMSEGLGKPLSGEVSYSVDIPELAPLFDGTEQLRAIISLPWYWREKYVP